ncbi:MAG: hypothetical protein ACP5M4_08745 [Acidobacteriaceae bacterium]
MPELELPEVLDMPEQPAMRERMVSEPIAAVMDRDLVEKILRNIPGLHF